jgi:hypothetical protein
MFAWMMTTMVCVTLLIIAELHQIDSKKIEMVMVLEMLVITARTLPTPTKLISIMMDRVMLVMTAQTISLLASAQQLFPLVAENEFACKNPSADAWTLAPAPLISVLVLLTLLDSQSISSLVNTLS